MNVPHPSQEQIRTPRETYDLLRNVTPEHACPYLPGRNARNEVYWVEKLDSAFYERLLSRSFRRSGRAVYRPRCRNCRECHQIRVLVDRFAPSRSMRRVWQRGRDIRVEFGEPSPSDEKFDLYVRYLDSQHDESMNRSYEAFREFLYDSPTRTVEFRYRLGGRLLGVSLADVCPDGLSSVYMYFDPEFARRSPGTFSILWEIDYCRKERMPYYYLGFYVAESRTMSYKGRFRPSEILVSDNRWLALPE